MSRSLVSILSICLIAATPAVALARPDAAPVGAQGVETRAELARAAVDAHFNALTRGDGAAVKALWTRDARITSVDAEGKSVTRRLAPALRRWMAHREGIAWEITRVRHIDEDEVEVFARVTWNGSEFDDRIRLRIDRRGKARIARKSSRPSVTGTERVPPRSGY